MAHSKKLSPQPAVWPRVAMRFCSRPRAPATTCSTTTWSAVSASASWLRKAMTEAVQHVRYRWHMTWEARVLTMLTLAFLAFGLVTVYSASSIVALQAGHNGAYYMLRQLSGMLFGLVLFAFAAKFDAE